MSRLGAGRSWVQIPVEVRDIVVHPASYSMGTSIDGKVNECSRTSTHPICIHSLDRDNFNFLRIVISLLPITVTACNDKTVLSSADSMHPSSNGQWALITTA